MPPFAALLVSLLVTLSPPGGARDDARSGGGSAAPSAGERMTAPRLRIDLVDPKRRRTPAPPGWLAYDGARYSPTRGYGWIDELPPHSGADRGEDAPIVLPNGAKTSPRLLGRPELAHWQGTHRENRPLVFRADLPNGWYRVTCTSVDPGTPLPLVDQRSFKCRAHDVVFAGPKHGRPLAVSGMTLVEGADVVEVTEGHLRVVIGDPAYPGWTWRHPEPWYEGWQGWFGRRSEHRYAERWYQKLTRTVDPGFHSLRLNSLEIEPAPSPPRRASPVFRDFFARDDGPDIDRGVPETARWTRVNLDAGGLTVRAAIDKTALALTGSASRSTVAFVQPTLSPARGVVRYSARVSLFTGEGSRAGSGLQEAGLLLLADPAGLADSRSTFVGVTVSGAAGGGLTVRVGDGDRGFQSDLTVGPPQPPLDVGPGEYHLVVDHDVRGRVLRRVVVNDVDVTALVPPEARLQRLHRGLFGIRAVMAPGASGVTLRQFYWFVRVECAEQRGGGAPC